MVVILRCVLIEFVYWACVLIQVFLVLMGLKRANFKIIKKKRKKEKKELGA